MKDYCKMPQIMKYMKSKGYERVEEDYSYFNVYENITSKIIIHWNVYEYEVTYQPNKNDYQKKAMLISNTQKGIIDMLKQLEVSDAKT